MTAAMAARHNGVLATVVEEIGWEAAVPDINTLVSRTANNEQHIVAELKEGTTLFVNSRIPLLADDQRRPDMVLVNEKSKKL